MDTRAAPSLVPTRSGPHQPPSRPDASPSQPHTPPSQPHTSPSRPHASASHEHADEPPTSGPIDRLGPDDLTYLAAGPSSSNLGVVLEFDGPAPTLDALLAALAPRVAAVPRLRQRIRRLPRGYGRPIWVDDAGFDLREHVTVRTTDAAIDTAALASLAATEVARALPSTRPLWAMTLVTGPDRAGPAGLIVVIHHVLTDGIGGLAVLAALADEATVAPARAFPRPVPTAAALRADARQRWRPDAARLRRAAASLRSGWRELFPSRGGGRGAVAEATAEGAAPGRPQRDRSRRGRSQARPPRRARSRRGPSPAPASAPRCALNAPTGPRRAAAVARVPLDEVRTLGRTVGATVNDVLLAAIGGALASYLDTRGEHPHHLVASVPVSRREETGAASLGNAAGVMLVALPLAEPDPVRRLERIAAATESRRGSARGSSLAVLSPVFRALSTMGVMGWMIDRQRMVNVFVSNVRGPGSRLHLGQRTVTGLIPFGALSGNVAVTFTVLSYAGTLTITVTVDPDVVADPAPIAAGVEREMAVLGGRLAR